MQQREQQLQIHGIQLLNALIEVNNATVRFEVLSQEKSVHKGTKKQIDKCINELRQIRKRFDRFWGEEGKQIMDSQILSDDDTLQIQNINALVISLPKGIRNQVENYTEGLAKIYAAKT